MKFSFRVSLVCLTALGALFSGCGHDIKVSVKTADSERHEAPAASARAVVLTYRDPTGKEQLRESFKVEGLSAPLSVNSEKLKGLTIEKDGIFEAKAIAANGLAVLEGVTKSDPGGSDEALIVLTAGKPVFSGLRLTNAGESEGFRVGAEALHGALREGRCLELPEIKVESGGSTFPRLRFEGVFPRQPLTFEAGIMDANGKFQAWPEFESTAGPQSIAADVAGGLYLELGPSLNDGALTKGHQSFVLRFYTNRYEGCLKVATRSVLSPLVPEFVTMPGTAGRPQDALIPVARMSVYNPNNQPLLVTFKATLFQNHPYIQGSFLKAWTNATTAMGDLSNPAFLVDALRAEPHAGVSVWIFGGVAGSGFQQSGFSVRWEATGVSYLAPTPEQVEVGFRTDGF